MDYQTHELFHDSYTQTFYDSIVGGYLPPSQYPKRDSSIGATRVLFLSDSEASGTPYYVEINKKYLDLILASRRWKVTASVSGTLGTSNMPTEGGFNNTNFSLSCEGMFDYADASSYSSQYGSSSEYVNIATRNFDNGAISQLEGTKYKTEIYKTDGSISFGSTESILGSGTETTSPASILPYFNVSSSFNIPFGGATSQSSNLDSDYGKSGNIKIQSTCGNNIAGVGLRFDVRALIVTESKCYIAFQLGFNVTNVIFDYSATISETPIYNMNFYYETPPQIIVLQNSVAVNVCGTQDSRYKMYQQTGSDSGVVGSINSINIDILQVEAL